MNPSKLIEPLKKLEYINAGTEAAAFRIDDKTVALLMRHEANHKVLWLDHIGILQKVDYAGQYLVAQVPFIPTRYDKRSKLPAYIEQLLDLYHNYDFMGFNDLPMFNDLLYYEGLSKRTRSWLRRYADKLEAAGIPSTELSVDTREANIRKHKGRWFLYDPWYRVNSPDIEGDPAMIEVFCRA